MINVLQDKTEYKISFSYNPDIVFLIKQIPGRKWNPEKKFWSIPLNNLGFLINQFKGTPYEKQLKIISMEQINVNKSLSVTTKIPDVDVSKLHFYVDGTPYAHQIDFMKFAIKRQQSGNTSGFLLADDQGCGKTIEAMNLAIYNKQALGFKRVLIICCVNSAKYHWQTDIYKHTNGKYKPYILGTRKKKNKDSYIYDTSSKEKLYDLETCTAYNDKSVELPYFIVTNIETLRTRVARNYPVTSAIIDLCNNNKINMIIIDEVHKNTSPTSKQGSQLLEIKKRTDKKIMWLPLTGTPITNKPTDLYLPLALIGAHSFKNFYLWKQQFCIFGGYNDKNIIAYKNLDKLKLLFENNMIRRVKSDILDLPDKIYYTEYIENTKYQQKLYDKQASNVISNFETIGQSLNPLSYLLKLRQINGSPELIDPECIIDSSYIKKNAKLQCIISLLEEIHDRKEKVVVYSNWLTPLRMLYRILSKKYSMAYYTGTMKEIDRENQKKKFMIDTNCTVLLGTIGALGTMHTLTAANNVIFIDEPWVSTDKIQAEDRCHRIGTTKPVNIYTIITKNTVDERVHDILYKKSVMIDYMINNKLDIKSNPELLNVILKDNI